MCNQQVTNIHSLMMSVRFDEELLVDWINIWVRAGFTIFWLQLNWLEDGISFFYFSF